MAPARKSIRAMPRPRAALRQILRPLGKKFGPGVYELQLNWAQIAGPRLAGVCAPERLVSSKNGQVLTIRTKGSAAMLVQAGSVQLLERVNLVAGFGRVTELRIKQGRIMAGSPVLDTKATKTSCRPEEIAALDVQLADIDDPDLKAALKELGLGVIGRDQTQ